VRIYWISPVLAICWLGLRLSRDRFELQLRILVTGGAGFLGSHLVDRLMQNGDEVICVDNLCTGNKQNLLKWFNHDID
jgi:nucleoside-diphosphate-sugar epimerase